VRAEALRFAALCQMIAGSGLRRILVVTDRGLMSLAHDPDATPRPACGGGLLHGWDSAPVSLRIAATARR